MMSDELYAALGRKQLAFESLNAEYDRLLVLLSSVVTGIVPRETVTVDLERRSWALTPATPVAAADQASVPDAVPVEDQAKIDELASDARFKDVSDYAYEEQQLDAEIGSVNPALSK